LSEREGWLPWVSWGETAGTTGEERRLEAMHVRSLDPNYHTWVNAHIQDSGWQGWVKDGISGTTGQKLRMEAFKLRILTYYLYWGNFLTNHGSKFIDQI
jgi:glutamyl endopeptidase